MMQLNNNNIDIKITTAAVTSLRDISFIGCNTNMNGFNTL